MHHKAVFTGGLPQWKYRFSHLKDFYQINTSLKEMKRNIARSSVNITSFVGVFKLLQRFFQLILIAYAFPKIQYYVPMKNIWNV